jgi:lysophospholipase L1-like esterase
MDLRAARRFLLKLALVTLVTLVLAVAGVEAVLRASLDHKPSLSIYAIDFETGKSMKPSFRGIHYQKEVTINSRGMRDAEHERARPPGVQRILVLGDSWTFGVGVELESTWPRRLEEVLERDGHAVDVMNAGVPGDGTYEEAIRYARLRDLEHDLVLVGFYPVNDVHEDYQRYARHRWLHDLHPALLDLYKFPERHLYLSHWIKTLRKDRKERAKLAHHAEVQAAEGPAPRRFARLEEDWTALYSESDAGWRTVVSSLADIGRIARESGARGVVVLLPDLQDLERYTNDLHPGFVDVLRLAVAAAGLELIDLAEDFRPHAGEESEIGLGGGPRPTHPNGRGYRIIASSVARELVLRGLIGSDR